MTSRRVMLWAGALFAASMAGLASPIWGQTHAGVGLVHAVLDADRPLYFYDGPGSGGPSETDLPVDSVVFTGAGHHIAIAYAPPWLAAAFLKLDYDLMVLRAETLTRTRIEVVVNDTEPLPRFTPRTAWVEREAVRFRPWSDALLDVFAVRPVDEVANPVRVGPGDEQPEAPVPQGRSWRPIAVRGEWVRVEATDGSEVDETTGWMRWRRDGVLLVQVIWLS